MKNVNKDIDATLYSEKSLYLLNIRELRDLGRKVGVPAPASLKKQELVDYILKIIYGEVVVPARSLRGRPNVREFDMNKYLDKIKRNSELTSELVKVKLDTSYDFGSSFGYGSMLVSSPTASFGGEFENIKHRVFYDDGTKCYLRVREFVESKDDAEISRELAERLGLENLDIIEILEEDGSFKIVTINGKKLDRKLADLMLDDDLIGEGTSQDFYVRTKEEVEEKLKTLAKNCEQNNIKLIVFATKKYTYKTTESVVYDTNESVEQMYKKIMMLFSVSEKAVYEMHDFVIAVENFDDIENCLNSCEKDVSERSKAYIQKEISKINKLANSWVAFRLEKSSNY